ARHRQAARRRRARQGQISTRGCAPSRLSRPRFRRGRRIPPPDAHAAVEPLPCGNVPRIRPAGHHRLPVGDELRVPRVDGATGRANHRPADRGLPGVHAGHHCGGARAERLPHPLDAPPVRAAHRLSQDLRIAPLHALVRAGTGPDGVAQAVRLAGHARRGTVRSLVTGATGFTGGHLARALVGRGDTVSALVRDEGPAAAALAQAGVALVRGDVRDPAAVAAATADVDVVYHIAAMYRQAGLPDETYRAVIATAVREIVEAAARAGATRVVHCSTVGVHGDIAHPPANEDAPLDPGDIYQVTD